MAEESIFIKHKWYIISASTLLLVLGAALTYMGSGKKEETPKKEGYRAEDKDGKDIPFSENRLMQAGVGIMAVSGLILVAYLLMALVF